MKKVGWLAGATILFWALLVYPGWLLFGNSIWVARLTALGLCLIPALASLAWTLKTSGGAPEMQLVAILGGSGIRMAIALGGGLLLHETLPEMFANGFWLWMVLFYMFILAIETVLI